MDSPRVFDTVSIIFNPNSTGDAPKLASELYEQLGELLPDETDIRLQPTEHAVHAIDLSRDAAAVGNTLVVSVSGDGGYNEGSTA
ncbi:diacylglycerol kinase family protein [Arthrobacter sp. CAN_C5]|uniref:diacylglycerol kinase family protein n=1 Tax=Arthrobacter sp. CAN_C5 TaxID=2760706 RepID=UPI001FD8A24E|nr:diacylglycerol kinase family protein [Arthrobacter sp. CAN_C5]MBP2215137.1 diacylglycerol kinase family enzyme [Arthrobacter sp. CAN_C5]